MKLNKSFIGINYYLTKYIRNKVIDTLMSEDSLKHSISSGVISNIPKENLEKRLNVLNNINNNFNHKLFYISKTRRI